MTRLLRIAFALYVPHLVEEGLTGMHDDALIVRAFEPLASLSPRHASYLVFQIMLAITLLTTFLFAAGGRQRLVVVSVIGFSLVAEAHHLLRALWTLHGNSGLVTSLPMPIFGVYMLRRVIQEWL
jgi:hypothetical protein